MSQWKSTLHEMGMICWAGIGILIFFDSEAHTVLSNYFCPLTYILLAGQCFINASIARNKGE